MDPNTYKKKKSNISFVVQWLEAVKRGLTMDEYEKVKAVEDDPFSRADAEFSNNKL